MLRKSNIILLQMIKLVYEGKNKIIKLEHPTFSQLRTQVKQTFHDLPPDYSLSYLDQDNDEICVNSDDDLSIMLSAKLKMTKVFIKMSFSQVINMDSFMTEEIRPSFEIYESAVKEEERKDEPKKEEAELAREEIVVKPEPAYEELVEQKQEDHAKQQPAKQRVVQVEPVEVESVQNDGNSILSESASEQPEKKAEEPIIQIVKVQGEVEPNLSEQSEQFLIKVEQREEVEQEREEPQQIQKKDIPQEVEQEISIIGQKKEENKLTASEEYVANFFPRQDELAVKINEKKEQVVPARQVINVWAQEVEKPKIVELTYHGVVCSLCKDDYGIIGIMYQCILCDSFNICQNCESTVDHPHSLVQVKKAGGAIKRDQIIQKYGKEILDQAGQRKPLVPVGHYVPSISKDEANRCLKAAENLLKQSFERSQKTLDDMFLKLSMSHKNPYEVIQKEPSSLRKKIPETVEEKARQLMDFVKISYIEALKFVKTYPKMKFDELLNTYFNVLQHEAAKKK